MTKISVLVEDDQLEKLLNAWVYLKNDDVITVLRANAEGCLSLVTPGEDPSDPHCYGIPFELNEGVHQLALCFNFGCVVPTPLLQAHPERFFVSVVNIEHLETEIDIGVEPAATEVSMKTQVIVPLDSFSLIEPAPHRHARLIHFIWSGREISDTAFENIMSWVQLVGDSGWYVYIWTDQVNNTWSLKKKNRILWTKHVKRVQIDQNVLDARLWPFYHELIASAQPNYPAASDLARYSILHKYGGVYVDVDIAPGGLPPLQHDTNWNPYLIPKVAPCIRDYDEAESTLEEVLRLSEESLCPEEREMLCREDPRHLSPSATARLASFQFDNNRYNNNFLVLSAGSPVMENIIEQLESTLANGSFDALLEFPDNAAFTTGPEAIFKGTRLYITEQFGVTDASTLTKSIPHVLTKSSPV